MAQIKIKRGSGVPAGLTHGELAYDVTNKRLYIGVTSASQLLTNTDGGVSSFNGLTGAVTGVTTGTANTFQALQSFAAGISASGGGTLSNGTYNFSNLKMNTVGGDEGGQIDFGLPAGSSLSTAVAFDIFQNKVRIFETGGTNRGVYIDLAGVSAGVGTNLVGGGGGAVSSVSGSGNGILVSPTTGAVVVQNTGVHSVNGSTGAVTNIAATNAAQTFTGLQTFTNGISASGGTFGTVNLDSIITDSASALTISGGGGGINLSDSGSIILDTASPVYIGDYSGNVNSVNLIVDDGTLMVTTQNSSLTTNAAYLANGEYIRNTTNGRVDIMPAPTGTTHYGMYFDTTSWGFGVIMGTVRSSDGAINTGGNFRFDVPVTILNDTRFQLGSDGHYGFYRTDTGNNTAQIYALSNNANNSGAFALVSYFGVGNANRSPATSHTHPNFYIYANGTTSANDFVRFEHNSFNGNIVSGGTTGILIQPGSGQLGISGGICGGAYILNSSGILALTGTTYSLQASDNGEILTMNNGSPITVTVPSGLPVGYSVTVIQLGAGQVSFSASGTTINSYLGYTKIAGQHGSASLVSYSSNVFNLAGSLSA